MSNHLTHRFWLCIILGAGAAVVALATRELEPLAVGVPFLAVVAASIVDGWWPQGRITAAEISAPRAIEGDELTVTIDVTADDRLHYAELEVQLPAIFTATGPTRFIDAIDGTTRFEIRMRADRWGATGPEWALLTTRDRFGVSERHLRHPLYVPTRIHPPTERLVGLLPLSHSRPVTGDHRSRRQGSGTELAEVRPYRFGDPVRMIHPRLSQRRGSPTVVERHPDESSDVVLFVDSMQDLGVELDTTLRWTITAATALSERHLRAQDRVGLLDAGLGIRWFPARLGRRHLHQVVDALLSTEVLPRDQRQRALVVPEHLPSTAMIVAISPLLTEPILTMLIELRTRGHDVVAIRPEFVFHDAPVSPLARRLFRVGNTLNHRWLTERGVTIVPWTAGDPLEALVRRVGANSGRAGTRR